MKKTFVIICLLCLSITGYSQSKKTKKLVQRIEEELFSPNSSSTNYESAEREIYAYYMTFIYGTRKEDDKKLLDSLEKRITDSISVRDERNRRIANQKFRSKFIADSLRKDSIRIVREVAKQHLQDSIKVVQELKRQRDEAVRDSINEIRAKDPDFDVVKGKGNGTFSNSPNILAQIFKKNATVESIVATFQRYRGYYAEEFPDGRRTRSYDVYKGNEHYSVKLEYYAKTRKVKTIIIDDPYTDKFKQRLLNAGYRWDSSSSMTATSFGHGYRSYWKKNGSRVCFVFDDRTIKVFRID
ncbi:MAG: hypothetical protein RL662_226 [Bacteroidota bacterium]|jgi:hypothetical protein